MLSEVREGEVQQVLLAGTVQKSSGFYLVSTVDRVLSTEMMTRGEGAEAWMDREVNQHSLDCWL